MDMKKTILSEKELRLLESLISSHGYIVTFGQVEAKLGISRQSTRNLVAKLVRNGWLVRVKRRIHEWISKSGIPVTKRFKAREHWGHNLSPFRLVLQPVWRAAGAWPRT
ncbi:MAG: type IV toxin-antitoxin system AbiEi family antitoxin domain-containing protein [Thermoleophilia bacterium]|nr:type IV toxin-antitoxin system AbiEi family antitoxin domain-containing protein [Thermoleophilia bacterium]